MGYSEEEQLQVFHECLGHDVGKLFVPKEILDKPGSLDHDETTTIQFHPGDGAYIESLMKFPKGHIAVAKGHQRYFNTSGYPVDLPIEEVSMNTRIVMVADVHDAIIDPRRRGWQNPASLQSCRSIMSRLFDDGKFDPSFREAYQSLYVLEDFKRMHQLETAPEAIAHYIEQTALQYLREYKIISEDLLTKIQELIM